MALITLAEIRAALKTRLETLLDSAATPGPFVCVVSHAGRAERVDLHTLAGYPAVVVCFATEKYETKGSVRQLRGVRMAAGDLLWAVYVVVVEEQSPETVADSTTDTSLDVCIDAVLNSLVGFSIQGLAKRGEVELVESAPEKERNGVFAHKILVRTQRPIEPAAADTSALVPVVLRGDINRGDDAPDPRVTFEADPDDT